MNYFELYNFPIQPVADPAEATKRYFGLQKKYHPDFYTNESEEEKENAMMQSAAANKGYIIFKDREKTIEYYLQLKGLVITDEKYNLPADFLMEMMELNEAFDEEGEEAVKKRAAEYEKTLNEEIEPLLTEGKRSDLSNDELQDLKYYYYRKKYLRRIMERE